MRIYVGNLNYQVTEDNLRELFSKHGQVDEVAMITDRDTGKARGFAFVTMNDDAQAKAAVAAENGAQFMGRTLVVSEAKARPGGGGGGGGGRGFGRGPR